MRFLFLNQYFPPDPAPTGVLFRELADALAADGHEVDFVAARQDYRAGQKQGGRMRRELAALWRMLLDGFGKPRPDVVISGTSPPCLLVVAMLVAMRHRAKSVHWIMDMYPEIAVALGEIKPGIVASLTGWAMRRGYRHASAVVALDEDMAARVRLHGVEPAIIRPWVFESVLKQLAAAHAEPSPEWTWIYSGNLGRAHEWETLLAGQAIIEQRAPDIHLLFQGGGPSWPAAQARAKELGLRHCEWREYAPESDLPDSLRRCHVLTVTQLPDARGLLWPSKLGLAMATPRPLLWIGPIDGAIAARLRTSPYNGVFAPGQSAEVADWLIAQKARVLVEVSLTSDPVVHRTAALATWKRLLQWRPEASKPAAGG